MADQLKPYILACDLDGTLVDDSGHLYPGATELMSLAQRGVKIGLASARSIRGAQVVADRLGPLAFLSALQGGQIVVSDSAGGESYFESHLPESLVSALVAMAQRGYEVWMYTTTGWFTSTADSFAIDGEEQLVGFRPDGRLEDRGDASVLKGVVVTLQQLEGRETRRIEHSGGILGRSADIYTEIVGAETPKAKGLEYVSRLLSGSDSRADVGIVAVGNSINDLEMLSFADQGFTFEDERIAENESLVTLPSARAGGLHRLRELIARWVDDGVPIC